MSSHDRALTLREQVAPVVRALEQSLGDSLVSVVLFGSRARGEARPDSDWDLLVIAEHLPDRLLKRSLFVVSLLPPQWRHRVAIVAKTRAEFESALPSPYLDIAVDGIILYDRSRYVAAKLAYLQRRISELGLRRVELNGDRVWLWRNPPGSQWSLEWTQ